MPKAAAAAPVPMCWMLVGAAPAAEVAEAAAEDDAVLLAVELAVEDEDEVVAALVALAGSRVPHLS